MWIENYTLYDDISNITQLPMNDKVMHSWTVHLKNQKKTKT